MKDPDIKSRQDKVLEHIVNAYIELGVPIGSLTICNRANLNLSPATIRNIMGELEDLGLITQPHTSAGRVPTDLGYRYYLDKIMRPEVMVDDEKEKICSVCDSNRDEPDFLLEEMSRLLSDISNEASMAVLPKSKRNMPKDMKLVSFGWHHLFGQPEFKDALAPSRVLRVFEEKTELLDFVEENVGSQGVKIFVGKEHACSDISDCSVVISSYGFDNDVTGAIGVIGPKRMPYKRVVPVVDYIVGRINAVLKNAD